MHIKLITVTVIIFSLFESCGNDKASQIGENTFVYKSKVYKLIDNELTQIADLDEKGIRKFEILKPQRKTLGVTSLSYVKIGATGRVDALYRGNYLYFKLYLEGINDLKENYLPGRFTIEFADEYGFIIHSTEILTSDLIGYVGDEKKIDHYEYNGKTEMSTDINAAIKTYSISSTVKAKNSLYNN